MLKDTETPTITGKARVVLDIYDFKYYIEQQWSNGEWRRNHSWPSFPKIDDAKAHFERSKAARKQLPADLGSFDDA
jgi:hypothetical protein